MSSHSYRHRKFLSFLFGIMMFLPLFFIVGRLWVYWSEDKNLENISEITASYTITAPAVIQNSENCISSASFMDISGLKEINPDTEGYIRIEGTQISYPVMRSDESEKYLRRDFYGNKSVYGSIFMDPASYAGGTNLLLYGHNMKSGKMFGELKRYLEADFAKEHQVIHYITEDEIKIYDLCGVFRASASDERLVKNLIPYTKNEFDELISYIDEHQGIWYQNVQWGEELITLATCEYTNRNGRLFVMGKLTSVIERRN